MLRITHISTAETWRGGEQQIAYLTKYLNGKTIQILYCPENAILNTKVEDNIQIVHFTKNSSLSIKAAKKLYKNEQRTPSNIIHCHDSHAHNIYLLSSLIFGLKTPAVITRRIERPITSIISKYKYNYPRIEKIACVSEAVKRMLQPSIKSSSTLLTIHSGIDIDKFKQNKAVNILRKEFSLPEDSFIIGNIGALTDQKDHQTFIKTAKEIIRQIPHTYFFIAGEGELKEILLNQITQENLKDHVFLLGFRNDIPDLLNAFDIFLFTSIFEGIGTTLLDAIAANVPIVSTNVSGIPEIITHNFNGFIHPPKDVKHLAESTIYLLKSKELRDKFAVNGKITVQNFSYQQTGEKYLQLYKQISKT
ncbi:MAG: glycosyltransferase family 4 protein [Chitinophagales bacterium]|nr:glycosyltransferase family 4 protein [Chitinophagales bacterium]